MKFRNIVYRTLFSFSSTYSTMAFDMSYIISDIESFTLDRYIHQYHLSVMHGVLLPFFSSSNFHPPSGKVRLYMQHFVFVWQPSDRVASECCFEGYCL